MFYQRLMWCLNWLSQYIIFIEYIVDIKLDDMILDPVYVIEK